MRHRQLHAALTAFAEEAAWRLSTATADGAEVPFEVVTAGPARRRDTPLYCYRPMTERFVRERGGIFAGLSGYPAAAKALEPLDGVGDYLREQGEPRVPVDPRDRANAALQVFVSRMFSEATDFTLTPERFERAWRELEAALGGGRTGSTIVAPLFGVEIVSEEVPLGDGLTLVRDAALEDPPAEALRVSAGTLLVYAATDEPGAPPSVTAARVRFRRLLSALRLFDDALPALAPVAWSRTGEGPWALVPLVGACTRPRGTLAIPEDGEDELRAFCSLVGRRTPRSGELAWALARYEAGCERPTPFEALTDHLLALRALLEPEGPASGRLAGRVAALCATEDEHDALAERVAQAVALERGVVTGVAPATTGAEALVTELSAHLRALLRDVLCGHLDPDLRAAADELLEPATAS